MYGTGDNTTLPGPETKITASDGAQNDEFGSADTVAVGSDRIVIGSPFDDDAGGASGSAYIFDLDGNLITKITASDAAGNDRFGRSVAVGSSRIVVGAYFDDDNGSNSGSAYIFDLNGNQLAKITASDGAADDNFGDNVAVGSGRIVVGAPADDDNGTNSGSAYIFDLNGNQLAKITASDGAASDDFGEAVAVGNGRIVVGAFFDDIPDATNAGSAYIFDLNGNELTKITASDATGFEQFGRKVAVGNGRIVVGAPTNDTSANNGGAVFIFDLEGNELAKITANDASDFDLFGDAVSIGSGRIVVGAPFTDDNGTDSGSAYVFDLEGNQLTKILASDGTAGDELGQSVAVGSGRIVVGAPNNDLDKGAVYVFSTPDVVTPYDVRDWEDGY